MTDRHRLTTEQVDAVIRRVDVPSAPEPDFIASSYAALEGRARAARVRDARFSPLPGDPSATLRASNDQFCANACPATSEQTKKANRVFRSITTTPPYIPITILKFGSIRFRKKGLVRAACRAAPFWRVL